MLLPTMSYRKNFHLHPTPPAIASTALADAPHSSHRTNTDPSPCPPPSRQISSPVHTTRPPTPSHKTSHRHLAPARRMAARHWFHRTMQLHSTRQQSSPNKLLPTHSLRPTPSFRKTAR